MKIGELAAATGATVETLRFYESRGLIAAERRTNGYREFPAACVEIVRSIRYAREFGFALSELTALRDLSGDDRAAAIRVKLVEKAAELEARIAELTELRARLEEGISGACPMQRESARA